MQIFSRKDKINIIKRIAIATITLIVMVVATVAWFTANEEVFTQGMKLVAEPGSRLTIAKSASELSTEASSVTFTEEPKTLKAATHNWNPMESAANSTGLWYNTNPNVVDYSSGLSKVSSGLKFLPVPLGSEGTYYVDYRVYLAATEAPITVNSFLCTLSLYNPSSIGESSYIKAASIDFYLGEEVNEANYRGTLNLAGLTWENTYTGTGINKVRDPRTVIDLVTSGSSLTFPLVTTGQYVLITMRVYMDGALTYFEQPASSIATDVITKTFVHAEGLVLENFGMKVDFETQESETESSK